MASCSDDEKIAAVATARTPPTRVCLIRHGETASNAGGRLQGQLDVPLNARGRDQALLAATALAERFGADTHSIAAMYTSDLSRARETCDCIARAFATAPVVSTSALRERHLGALQGIVRSEAAALHPAAWRALVSRDPHHELDGGESIVQFGKRVGDALDLIRGAHVGRTVLVVCHGGVIDVAHRIVTQTPMDARRTVSVPNASLSWISHDGAAWQVDSWADTKHLDGQALESVD
jgi:probable phosphoglycerate mutase